jgi:exopolysaccharide biosynthesis polyprenyl glycosylphosphotransferase
MQVGPKQTTMYMDSANPAARVEIDKIDIATLHTPGTSTRPTGGPLHAPGASRRWYASRSGVEGRPRRSRRYTVRRALVCGDILGLALALGLYELLWGGLGVHGFTALPLAVATIGVTLATAHLLGLYNRDLESVDHTTADEIFTLLQAVTLSAWLLVAASFLTGSKLGDPRGLVVLWALAMGLMLCARVAARALTRREGHRQRTLILGSGEVGQWVAQKLLRNPRLRLELVGFVDGRPLQRRLPLEDLPVLGGPEQLRELVRAHEIERVIVAFSGDSDARTLQAIRALAAEPIQIDIVPRLFETVGLGAGLHLLEGLPLIGLTPSLPSTRALAFKRAIDVTVSTVALVALLPLMALVALAVKLDSPGPALYLGERVGRNGRRFRLCKFRTMHTHACRGERYGGAEAEALFEQLMSNPARRAEFQRVRKLRNDPRVTRFGALLRRTSLDELPQLLNVIRGELSLVGPRPVTAYEYDQLDLAVRGEPGSEEDAVSLHLPPGYWEGDSIRPGVTGYWQVMARSNVGYEERLRLDLTYMTSWSLKLDLQIAAKTLGVLAGHGAY